jgi:CRISPR/Cas system CSM-associated protein Csm3 (group 7 of RAMP superfamily)
MAGPGRERPLASRWVLCASLVAEGPLHLGGEAETIVDAPILRDRVDGAPLLTGASLAGALRSHLGDVVAGYRQPEPAAVAELFGGARGDDEGAQSPLMVFDGLGRLPEGTAPEIRDGVAIDPATGTAEEHKKFDIEVLPAGTRFPLHFELLILAGVDEKRLLALLAATLEGLESGDVALGARTSRGYGRCRAAGWTARRFDLTARDGWLAWLVTEPAPRIAPTPAPEPDEGDRPTWSLREALRRAWPSAADLPTLDDRRRRFRAELDLRWPHGGLLVRSPGREPGDADATQLHSGGDPVLPGTSLAGALRTRALRIARLVCGAHGDARVEALFGPPPGASGRGSPRGRELFASRLTVGESRLEGRCLLQGTRIRIDRFTGGVVDGALFDEQPLYRGRGRVTLEIREPEPGEVGLLLLVIKDLLTGDLPLGGTGSVGRGVTRGTATLTWPEAGESPHTLRWDPEARVSEAEAERLNAEVATLHARADGPTGAERAEGGGAP